MVLRVRPTPAWIPINILFTTHPIVRFPLALFLLGSKQKIINAQSFWPIEANTPTYQQWSYFILSKKILERSLNFRLTILFILLFRRHTLLWFQPTQLENNLFHFPGRTKTALFNLKRRAQYCINTVLNVGIYSMEVPLSC